MACLLEIGTCNSPGCRGVEGAWYNPITTPIKIDKAVVITTALFINVDCTRTHMLTFHQGRVCLCKRDVTRDSLICSGGFIFNLHISTEEFLSYLCCCLCSLWCVTWCQFVFNCFSEGPFVSKWFVGLVFNKQEDLGMNIDLTGDIQHFVASGK